jgi:hypothetical protein
VLCSGPVWLPPSNRHFAASPASQPLLAPQDMATHIEARGDILMVLPWGIAIADGNRCTRSPRISSIGRLLGRWLDLVGHASVPASPGPQMTAVRNSVLADAVLFLSGLDGAACYQI